MHSSLIIPILLFCTTSYAHNDVHTIQYNKDNFDSDVAKNNHFVMFYAPWCGHCQRLAPTWDQLAEMLNEDKDSVVKIAKVDCTTDNEICSKHEVTGYPTLRFFKLAENESVKFKGTRDLPTLTAFINEQLGSSEEIDIKSVPSIPEPANGLFELTEDTFANHVKVGQHFVKFYAPWCGHCQKLAPIWEQLAATFEHDNTVSISKVDCTQHKPVCTQFEVKGYPTLLWIEGGKKIEKYVDQRTHEDLKHFIARMRGPIESNDSEKGSNDSNSKGIEKQGVFSLTGADFDQGVETGITFVKFFAPWCGHCKRLAPTWEELARKVIDASNVNIAKVDCTLEDNKELCAAQEVDGFPTLFLYKNGKKISEYNGSRSLDDLYEFIMSHSKHDEL